MWIWVWEGKTIYILTAGRHPLPPPLQLPLRPDQQTQEGADRGVEPVQGLWGPGPWGHRVQQRRDGVQVSRDVIECRLKTSNKVYLAATFWAEEEEEPGSGILRTLSLTLPQPLRCPRPLLCSRVWPLMGAHSASARPRVTEPTSRGHLRSYSTFQKSAPTNQHFYTSDKSTLWYQLALLLDHLIYTY